MNKVDLKRLAEGWPSQVIARHEIQKFTGGLLNPRTLANLDSRGEGPANRFYLGRRAAYFVSDFIEWMEARIESEIR